MKSKKGKRDRALLALLVSCGLRRQELAALRIEDIQQRDGRWCIVDLADFAVHDPYGRKGASHPHRSDAGLDENGGGRVAAAGFVAGLVLGAVNKGDRITGQGMSAQSIYEVVEAYGNDLGAPIAPHNMRRTFAKLAHKGRAPLEQDSDCAGHASIQTTERYLGARAGLEQDLTDTRCDHLGIRATRK